MTDLIYRVSVVQQLTEYNDNLIKELEALIEANKKKTIELENKQVEMEQFYFHKLLVNHSKEL